MAESVTSDFEAGDEEWTFLTVLGKGITFEYVVPSFPVFRANLTEVKLQWANREGELEVFDGFARDCAALVDQTLPAILKIPFNYDYAFTIEVCYNYIQCIIYLLSFRQVNSLDLLKILASINSMEVTQFLSCGTGFGWKTQVQPYLSLVHHTDHQHPMTVAVPVPQMKFLQ